MDNPAITPPIHFGTPLAGQTLEWLAPDTKESFEKLSADPEHRKYFAQHGWDQPGAIVYKINSHGFRCDEFDGGPYLVTLGCSYTLGYGLPMEDVWPYKLGKHLGLRVANLAWGGYSSDTCFRLAEYWVPTLKPDMVVMLTPPQDRLELLLDVESIDSINTPVEIFLPNSQSKFFNSADLYLKHWYLNSENGLINERKNSLAVKQLCADLNIPCYVLHSRQYMQRSREEIGYARDYLHGGPQAHDDIVRLVLELCGKNK